jgi:hypothetical protein
MNTQTVTIQLPKNIYDHLRDAARAQKRPMKNLLREAVSAGLPLVDDLPIELANEMAALALLNDDALRQKTRLKFSAALQKKMDRLLDKKQAGKLNETGQKDLNVLLTEAERVTLTRAQAAALLTQRGYRLALPNKPVSVVK